MSELKPCPFCGGSVTLERASETYSQIYGHRKWWGVVCRNTINRGGTCAIQQIPSASKEAATERWNRRAPVTPNPTTQDLITGILALPMPREAPAGIGPNAAHRFGYDTALKAAAAYVYANSKGGAA